MVHMSTPVANITTITAKTFIGATTTSPKRMNDANHLVDLGRIRATLAAAHKRGSRPQARVELKTCILHPPNRKGPMALVAEP